MIKNAYTYMENEKVLTKHDYYLMIAAYEYGFKNGKRSVTKEDWVETNREDYEPGIYEMLNDYFEGKKK